MINDTRGDGHPGCEIVMRRLAEECRDAGISVSGTLRIGAGLPRNLDEQIEKCDVVIINGEGTMHHDTPGALAVARAGIVAARRGRPVALINTVWQGNRAVNELLAHCAMIRTRESLSRLEIERAGSVASVVPDLTLSSPPDNGHVDEGAASVVVTDDVRQDLSLVLARYARAHAYPFLVFGRPRLRSVRARWKLVRVIFEARAASYLTAEDLQIVRRSSVLVTGRFHGVCLAILARRPFVAVDSNTHKTRGLLYDAVLGPGGRLCEAAAEGTVDSRMLDRDVAEVSAALASSDGRRAFERACDAYLAAARRTTKTMFQEIAALGRNDPRR